MSDQAAVAAYATYVKEHHAEHQVDNNAGIGFEKDSPLTTDYAKYRKLSTSTVDRLAGVSHRLADVSDRNIQLCRALDAPREPQRRASCGPSLNHEQRRAG